MRFHVQAGNFLRVLFRGVPRPGAGRPDPLATTAGHLKVVNMSVEDDRLASPEGNARYVRSLE